MDFRRESVVDLAEAVRERKVSARELTQAALDRIDALDGEINAFVALDPEGALAQAGSVDERIAAGDPVGELAGIPIGVKDLEDAVGFVTTLGSPVRAGSDPVVADSPEVARLRAAGCVVVGKTNTPEYGHKGDTENAVFGRTANPWAVDRSPGGSSGGSGAALAAGMVPLATGSDGGGSIRIPAALCGLSGLKTSLGRVPMGGPAPTHWGDLSVRGPMTRTIRDGALALDVVVGPDPTDMRSFPSPTEPWYPHLHQPTPPGRVGWSPTLGYTPVDDEIGSVCRRAVESIDQSGIEVVEIDEVFPEDPSATWFTIVSVHNLRALGGYRGTELWDEFDPLLRASIDFGEGVTASELVGAQDEVHRLYQRLAVVMEDIDVLLSPTVAGQSPRAGELGTINGEHDLNWVRMTYPFNLTGVRRARSVRASPPTDFPSDFRWSGASTTISACCGPWRSSRTCWTSTGWRRSTTRDPPGDRRRRGGDRRTGGRGAGVGGRRAPRPTVLVEAHREPLRSVAHVGGHRRRRSGRLPHVPAMAIRGRRWCGARRGAGGRHRDPAPSPGAGDLHPAHPSHARGDGRRGGRLRLQHPERSEPSGLPEDGVDRGRAGAGRCSCRFARRPGADDAGRGCRPRSGRWPMRRGSGPRRCSPTMAPRPRSWWHVPVLGVWRPHGRPSSSTGGTGSTSWPTGCGWWAIRWPTGAVCTDCVGGGPRSRRPWPTCWCRRGRIDRRRRCSRCAAGDGSGLPDRHQPGSDRSSWAGAAAPSGSTADAPDGGFERAAPTAVGVAAQSGRSRALLTRAVGGASLLSGRSTWCARLETPFIAEREIHATPRTPTRCAPRPRSVGRGLWLGRRRLEFGHHHLDHRGRGHDHHVGGDDQRRLGLRRHGVVLRRRAGGLDHGATSGEVLRPLGRVQHWCSRGGQRRWHRPGDHRPDRQRRHGQRVGGRPVVPRRSLLPPDARGVGRTDRHHDHRGGARRRSVPGQLLGPGHHDHHRGRLDHHYGVG